VGFIGSGAIGSTIARLAAGPIPVTRSRDQGQVKEMIHDVGPLLSRRCSACRHHGRDADPGCDPPKPGAGAAVPFGA
jgi:hypothetical protein